MGCGKSKTTPQTEDAPLLKGRSPEPRKTDDGDSSPKKKTTSGYSKLPQTDESAEETGGGDASTEAKLEEVVEEAEE